MLDIGEARLEIFLAQGKDGAAVVSAAHPTDGFTADTARLLKESTQSSAVCINPRGVGASSPASTVVLERMVEELESVRERLGLERWFFWGMSGGGWLAQLYAHRHPDALVGIIVESVCASFRERVADPQCALSPRFSAWSERLRSRGLLGEAMSARDVSRSDTEWVPVEGVGEVFRVKEGPAILVSPMPIDETMKRAMPAFLAFDSRAWLSQVRTPTLVIAGDADPVVPVRRVREVHEAIRGSAFVLVPGGGHVPSAQSRPEAVEAVRKFVAEHRGA